MRRSCSGSTGAGRTRRCSRHCRDHGVDWITYRRGTLADTTTAPRRYWRVDGDGRAETVTLADEMITIKDYGPARQLTLFEHDQPVLQVLTSDLHAPAAALLAWLRCRWRIENVFTYLTAHHGMDWLCHYQADTAPDVTPIANPDPVGESCDTLSICTALIFRVGMILAAVGLPPFPAAEWACHVASAAPLAGGSRRHRHACQGRVPQGQP